MLINTTFRKKVIRRRPGLLPWLADKHHSSSMNLSEGHGASFTCSSTATFAFGASIKRQQHLWVLINKPFGLFAYRERERSPSARVTVAQNQICVLNLLLCTCWHGIDLTQQVKIKSVLAGFIWTDAAVVPCGRRPLTHAESNRCNRPGDSCTGAVGLYLCFICISNVFHTWNET